MQKLLLALLVTLAAYTPSLVAASANESTFSKVEKSDNEWGKRLSPEVYHITREEGTEPAFSGEYNKFYKPGVYRCSNCGLPLFNSTHKYDSKTGWPSFWDPHSKLSVALEEDNSWFLKRTELICKRCGAHLGHLFDDGPAPTGMRYCINSLSLTFEATDDPLNVKDFGNKFNE